MSQEKEWNDVCDSARMTISRAIIHMRTGMFSASRADTLHAALLERFRYTSINTSVVHGLYSIAMGLSYN